MHRMLVSSDKIFIGKFVFHKAEKDRLIFCANKNIRWHVGKEVAVIVLDNEIRFFNGTYANNL